jgi:hypothetical protein
MLAAVIATVSSPGVASAATGVTGYTIAQGPSTAITPGESVSAVATCASGKVVLSGGMSAHSPLTFVSASYPSGASSWAVVATDTGNEAYTEHFTPYAVCVDASSVPGIHQVESPAEPAGLLGPSYNPPNVGAADAFCNTVPNEVVVGGGVSSDDPNTLLTISQPTSGSPAGWQAFVLRTGSAPGTSYFNVFAVCIPSADVSSYTAGSDASGAYGTFLGLLDQPPGNLPPPGAALTAVPPAVTNTAGAPYCGDGQLAVGGGAFNHDWETGGRISSVYPDSSGKYWLATSTEVDPPSGYNEYFLPSDICITGSVVEPTTLTAAPQLVLFKPFRGVGLRVVSATLTSGGNPVSGETISFSVGTTSLCSATTGANGTARCTVSATDEFLVLWSNHYTATFGGDSGYLASTVTTPAVTFF